jgi:signal transduction histidine kinase
MRGVLDFLAGRRWAGVGLAVVTELALLAALAVAPASAVVGLPAAVSASIAGTVAVVFGVADGVGVALAGAVVFAAFGHWEPGELAALGVWPAMVGAAGLFARRVNRQRLALRRLMMSTEEEKRALALTLHDESAQTLAAALMTLGGHSDTTAEARELITQTIRELRAVAADLSPKALEDYGLRDTLATLAEAVSDRTQIHAYVGGDWSARLSDEAERALYRFVQAGLGDAIARGARSVEIALNGEGDSVVLTISESGGVQQAKEVAPPEPASEHLRALGARLTLRRSPIGVVLRAQLPVPAFVR